MNNHIENLKLHQQWRLGEFDELLVTPEKVTAAIDFAIGQCEENKKLKSSLNFISNWLLENSKLDEFKELYEWGKATDYLLASKDQEND